jgi:hypothetical protein
MTDEANYITPQASSAAQELCLSQHSTPLTSLRICLQFFKNSPLFDRIKTEQDTNMAANGNQEHLGHDKEAGPAADVDAEHTAALNKIRTASSVTISPELFEKLYLSPLNRQNVVRADLRKTLGNPTPM